METRSKKQNSGDVSCRYALHGLTLPTTTLRALQKRGIYCTPGISLEHQHLAKRYVLRGVESGGAVADTGRACAYLSLDGRPQPWLQSIDSLAVNGRHAIVIAESLIRNEMLRLGRTYDLEISMHTLMLPSGLTRPEISSRMLIRGRDGVLSLDLWEAELRTLRGQIAPIFYNRAGEVLVFPERFEHAIKKMTEAVNCVGCRHTHMAVPPDAKGVTV